MSIKLEQAILVIIADAHNPSILSPEWLKAKDIITEESKDFIHTPDFVLFDSDRFYMTVDRKQLQIRSKKPDSDVLEALIHFGKQYFEILQHIPYKTLGINFHWLLEENAENMLPKIEIKINDVENIFSKIIPYHKIDLGCVVYAVREPYLMRLMIEPTIKGKKLLFNFNYHHEIENMDIKNIQNLIDNLNTLHDHSKGIVDVICSTKEKSTDI
jgi:hypothetical protein